MSLPRFNAELSLGRARGVYRGSLTGGMGSGDVLPTQATFASRQSLFPTLRCCRWAPAFGRFVCTSRTHSPWESCRCESGLFGPVILCRPIEITPTAG